MAESPNVIQERIDQMTRRQLREYIHTVYNQILPYANNPANVGQNAFQVAVAPDWPEFQNTIQNVNNMLDVNTLRDLARQALNIWEATRHAFVHTTVAAGLSNHWSFLLSPDHPAKKAGTQKYTLV